MGLSEEYEKEMLDSVTIYNKLFSYHKTIQQAVIYTLIDKYCKKHKFGFAIIDCDYYSFEDLKREKVSINTQKKFIKYVKDRGSITFDECDEFKKEYNINDYQICNIILNNSNQIIYQQHLIKYVI